MRALFIGSVYFSKITLELLLKINCEIVGIITKEISSFNSDFYDLSQIAIDNNIPFKYVRNINHENNVSWILSLKPDIIFCFGWSSLISKEIIDIPPMGVVGFHPALLPNNRGRHPLIWAKVLGLNKTGCTFFFMDEGADTGDILDQAEFEIMKEDNAEKLYKKMIDTSTKQILNFFPQLLSKTYSRKKQILVGNTWRKRSASDGEIDFRMSSDNILNLILALSKPYPGAHLFFNNDEVKVFNARIPNKQVCDNIEPGCILAVDSNSVFVKTGDSQIELLEHTFKTLPVIGDYIK